MLKDQVLYEQLTKTITDLNAILAEFEEPDQIHERNDQSLLERCHCELVLLAAG